MILDKQLSTLPALRCTVFYSTWIMIRFKSRRYLEPRIPLSYLSFCMTYHLSTLQALRCILQDLARAYCSLLVLSRIQRPSLVTLHVSAIQRTSYTVSRDRQFQKPLPIFLHCHISRFAWPTIYPRCELWDVFYSTWLMHTALVSCSMVFSAWILVLFKVSAVQRTSYTASRDSRYQKLCRYFCIFISPCVLQAVSRFHHTRRLRFFATRWVRLISWKRDYTA